MCGKITHFQHRFSLNFPLTSVNLNLLLASVSRSVLFWFLALMWMRGQKEWRNQPLSSKFLPTSYLRLWRTLARPSTRHILRIFINNKQFFYSWKFMSNLLDFLLQGEGPWLWLLTLVTCDWWEVTPDTWHLTSDMWHLISLFLSSMK